MASSYNYVFSKYHRVYEALNTCYVHRNGGVGSHLYIWHDGDTSEKYVNTSSNGKQCVHINIETMYELAVGGWDYVYYMASYVHHLFQIIISK